MAKILISNDDGIGAHGLNALRKELINRGHDVFTVVPSGERSAKSHGLTGERAMEIVKVEDQFYTCDGLPADCVCFALGYLLKHFNFAPDIVLSGINKGANLGQDIYYSGTVGAAREASFRGVAGISLSLVTNGVDVNENSYRSASMVVGQLIDGGIHRILDNDELLNINFPIGEDYTSHEFRNLGFGHYCNRYEIIGDVDGKQFKTNLVGSLDRYSLGDSEDNQLIQEGGVSYTLLKYFGQVSEKTDKKSRIINLVK